MRRTVKCIYIAGLLNVFTFFPRKKVWKNVEEEVLGEEK